MDAGPLALDWLHPDLGSLGAAAVYAVVLGFVLVESGLLVGFFLPGDTVLFAAGLLAAAPGSPVQVGWLVPGVVLAAVTGDAIGYATGRRLGRPWLERRVAAGRFPPGLLERAEAFVARWGAAAVVAARWIPWVRTFTPVLAGVGRMGYPRFLAANLVGALTWGAGLVLLGYVAASLPWVRHLAYAVAALAVAASLAASVLAARRGRSGRAPRG